MSRIRFGGSVGGASLTPVPGGPDEVFGCPWCRVYMRSPEAVFGCRRSVLETRSGPGPSPGGADPDDPPSTRLPRDDGVERGLERVERHLLDVLTEASRPQVGREALPESPALR